MMLVFVDLMKFGYFTRQNGGKVYGYKYLIKSIKLFQKPSEVH